MSVAEVRLDIFWRLDILTAALPSGIRFHILIQSPSVFELNVLEPNFVLTIELSQFMKKSHFEALRIAVGHFLSY